MKTLLFAAALLALAMLALKPVPIDPQAQMLMADGSDPMPLCRPQPGKPCPVLGVAQNK